MVCFVHRTLAAGFTTALRIRRPELLRTCVVSEVVHETCGFTIVTQMRHCVASRPETVDTVIYVKPCKDGSNGFPDFNTPYATCTSGTHSLYPDAPCNPVMSNVANLDALHFAGCGLPGVARRLPTFLARPRKVGQRRPPRCPAPSGCPALLEATGGCGTRPRKKPARTQTVLAENPCRSCVTRRFRRGRAKQRCWVSEA